MADVENILNGDDFFGDIVNTLKEDTEQHKKQECLKSFIGSGKAYLLGCKWTQEKVDKASDETINKTYAAYKQRKLNEKGKSTGRVRGTPTINLHSSGISRAVKIRDFKNLRQDIENDPIIKDQMVNSGSLLVYIFGDYLVPVLVVLHTVNNLDLGYEQGPENENYKCNEKYFFSEYFV